jgi:hypothetical protein
MTAAVDAIRLDVSGGRTAMDKITESLLSEFAKENQITPMEQDKQFEHFASYVVVRGEHTESFDSEDIVVGDDKETKGGADIGIDGIAIIANGILITDIEELDELADRAGYLEIVPGLVESSGSRRTARYATWTC